MSIVKAYMNWSGGKDAAFCLHKMQQDKNYSTDLLLTSINAAHNRISMHGVRRELLELQAKAIGIPLTTVELPEQPTMKEYEETMGKKLSALKEKGYEAAVFGDIFLEDLRRYREEKMASLGIECRFPLWNMSTTRLMEEFISSGFRAIVVCVNEKFLDKSFCGRIIDETFVRDMPSNVDICGENGEYHSFVVDGPVFKYPVSCKRGEIVRRTYSSPITNTTENCPADTEAEYGFYFCDLVV